MKFAQNKAMIKPIHFVVSDYFVFISCNKLKQLILDEQLVMLCVDIFNPALNANAITMQFLLQRLHFNPEILKKCQMEIDGVVGQGRLPTLSDRIK